MTDNENPPAPENLGSSVSSVIANIMHGIESAAFGIILSILTIFMPKLIQLGTDDLIAIGNSFRMFLSDLGRGVPWGTALADMLTRDWNAVEDDVKEIATDFAEAVAVALEKYGVLPQGE